MDKFPSEEGPGISVFYKNENGDILHTYSAYARGTEATMNTYNYLGLVPKGRNEDAVPLPCRGFAITTVTRMATSPTPISRTGLTDAVPAG